MKTWAKALLGFLGFLVFCAIVYYAIASLPKEDTINVQIIEKTPPIASGTPGTPGTQSAVVGKGYIEVGEVLKSGLANAVYSKNGVYLIVLLNNGELQIRKGGITMWRTNIFSPVDLKNCTARMERTGLVVRDGGDRVIWSMFDASYVDTLGLDIHRLVIENDGAVKLVDKALKQQYKINTNKLPAITNKSKIDSEIHIGSTCNDFVAVLSPDGTFIHATALPKLRDKAVYYAEVPILGSPSGFTSIEMVSTQLLGKTQGYLLTEQWAIISMNHAGDLLGFTDFDAYMRNEFSEIRSASFLIGQAIRFDPQQALDFMVIEAPYTLKSPVNPYFLHIADNGEITVTLRHIDQGLDKNIKTYKGIKGFKSDKSKVVLVFGVVFKENGFLQEELNTASVCVIDSRPFDVRDEGLESIMLMDKKKVIPNTAPLGTSPTAMLYQFAQASLLSRVIRVHKFDLVYLSQALCISKQGRLQFKDGVSGDVVGPIDPL